LALADQGFKVHLIERSGQLGGNLRELSYTLEHDDISSFAAGLITRINGHSNIKLHTETEVKDVEGHIGCFQVTLLQGSNKTRVPCGAIIVATGASPARDAQHRDAPGYREERKDDATELADRRRVQDWLKAL